MRLKRKLLIISTAITDLNNIEQLGFATQAIMLVTSLYCRLDDQDKDQLSTIISNLFIKLLKDFQVYAIPNVLWFCQRCYIFRSEMWLRKTENLLIMSIIKEMLYLKLIRSNLVFAILNLIKKSNLNQLSISKVQCEFRSS